MFSRMGLSLQSQARRAPRRKPAMACSSTLAREPSPLDAPQYALAPLVDAGVQLQATPAELEVGVEPAATER